jgi:hypothetical protein
MGRTRSRENRGELDQLPIPSQIPIKCNQKIKYTQKFPGRRKEIF